MDKYVVNGTNSLKGRIGVSGGKNVALKAIVAACLTDEPVIINNLPLISDVTVMLEIVRELGGEAVVQDHTVTIRMKEFAKSHITLDQAAHIRTSSMFLSPLLIRTGKAIVPNPGGCRIGARPIDRTVDGLIKMGASIDYQSDDGFFYAETAGLTGITYTFDKNTHTGTETLIIASVLAKGTTVLNNAAEEPEINELIDLLNAMGANIKRTKNRTIEIIGVDVLHGATCTILPDRNEVVTWAVGAYVTKGDIFIEGAVTAGLEEFLERLDEAGASYEVLEDGIRFFYDKPLKATDIETRYYPGFMTDWQASWAVLMTQAQGESTIHETVFSNRFGYANELKKMGVQISSFDPEVADPESTYNFDIDEKSGKHAIKITGPSKMHNAILSISDLRAGASLVIAALAATGETTIHGVHLIDRGYEKFVDKLVSLGANVVRVKDPYTP